MKEFRRLQVQGATQKRLRESQNYYWIRKHAWLHFECRGLTSEQSSRNRKPWRERAVLSSILIEPGSSIPKTRCSTFGLYAAMHPVAFEKASIMAHSALRFHYPYFLSEVMVVSYVLCAPSACREHPLYGLNR